MSAGYRVLGAADAFWRPSNATGVLNTDLAKQLETEALGARLWRLAPGQRVTKHRHASCPDVGGFGRPGFEVSVHFMGAWARFGTFVPNAG